MFGNKPAFGTSAFGATSSVFGTPQTGGSLFGASKPTVSFGNTQQTGGGLFGSTATTTANSLFGGAGTSNIFGTPAASTGSTFGAGTATGGLFGSVATTGSAFPAGSSMFSFSGGQQVQAAPAAGGGLFGTSVPSASGGTGLFGSTAQQTAGTAIKFNPLIGQDQMVKNSIQTTVNTRHQCITAMKEYENKSLEELRCEDYLLNRKGAQQASSLAFNVQGQQQPQASLGLFGSAAPAASSSSLFGTRTTFGTPATTAATGGLFGASQQTGGLFGQSKSLFSATTTTAGTGTGFTFGTPAATSTGLFGAQSQPQQTGLFGPTVVSTQAGGNMFGGTANQSLFGTSQPSNAFSFAKTTQAGLFGASQPAFGASTTSAAPATGFSFGASATPAFGTGTSLFGAKTTASTLPSFGAFGSQAAPTFGATQTSGAFGFGTSQPSTNLFGQTAMQQNRPLFGGTTNLFGQAPPFGQQAATSQTGSLFPGFGASSLGQQKTGFTTGFSAPAFGTSMPNMPSQISSIGTDPATLAAQQTLIQSQLMGLAQSPYGDSKLLKLLKHKTADGVAAPSPPSFELPKRRQEITSSILSPQSPISLKALPPTRPPSRVLTMSLNLKASQIQDKTLDFDDSQSNKLTFKEGYVPKRNVKKLVLNYPDGTGSKSRSKLSQSSTSSALETSQEATNETQITSRDGKSTLKSEKEPIVYDSDDTASSSVINGGRAVRGLDSTQNITPIVTPLSRRALARHQNGSSADETSPEIDSSPTSASISENVGSSFLRGGHENNLSTEISTSDNKKQPSKSAPHPAGIICTRSDYYTIPSLDELAAVVGEDGGSCFADGFTVGRYDYGSVFWPERIDVSGLNIDFLVHFRHKEVTVYPDDVVPKPPIGQALNRRAEITLERVWPNDKTTHLPIKDPKRLEAMRFRDRLERASVKMGAEFVDYRPDTGSWVFKVSHFSKYGLTDDLEEDEDVALEKKELSKDLYLQDKIQREKMETENLSQKSVKYPEDSMSLVEASSIGLGGIPLSTMEQAFDVDFSESEPSFLVKSDLSALFATNDENVEKIKHHLFYEKSAIKSELTMLDSNLFTQNEESFKENRSKRLFTTDLHDMSLTYMEKTAIFEDVKPAKIQPPKMPSQFTRLAQMVQPKNVLKLLPYEDSLLKDLHSSFDSSAFNGRRFRIGWFFDNKFLSCGLVETGKAPFELLPPSFVKSPKQKDNNRFLIGVNQPFSEDTRTNLVETLLMNQLDYSARLNRDGCPHLMPTNGAELSNCYVSALDNCGFNFEEKALVRRVFALCSALWGDVSEDSPSNYVKDILRKRNLSRWLSYVSNDKVERELEELRTKGNTDVIKAVFNLLSLGKVEEGAVTAFNNGDVRLSLALSLIGGSESDKTLFKQQLSRWYQSQTDRYIDEDRLKLYVLLSGYVNWVTSSGTRISVCEKLDWKRCFALCLRFCTPLTSTIADALKFYDEVCDSEISLDVSFKPYPDYRDVLSADSNSRNKETKKDICYHLLKLYSVPGYRLETVLNNETWTTDPLSYYLTWHVWCVLSALGYSQMSEQRKNEVHTRYAAQLERSGLWHWSLFVLMHIADEIDREKAVKRVLSLYAFETTEEQLNFLKNDLNIPRKWIFEAKALKAFADHDIASEVLFLVKSENWNLAHRLFVTDVGPTKLVDGNLDDLKFFMDELSLHSDEIENWMTGGQIFVDFNTLKANYESLKTLEDISPDNFNALKPLVLSLAGKIKYLPCASPLQRLCQSEMAFLVSQMLQLVFEGDKYLDMTDIITSLPMPDDFLLEELQRLVDKVIDRTNLNFT